ncbi:MAG: hypothetical protein ABI718_05120 [Acidobacteriota bacterium]
MIRRIAALIGIGLLLAILVLLVWTVHLHSLRTTSENTSLGLSGDAFSVESRFPSRSAT